MRVFINWFKVLMRKEERPEEKEINITRASGRFKVGQKERTITMIILTVGMIRDKGRGGPSTFTDMFLFEIICTFFFT